MLSRPRPRRAYRRRLRLPHFSALLTHARRARHLSREPFARPPARSDRRRPPRGLLALAIKTRRCVGTRGCKRSSPPLADRRAHRCAARRLHRSQSLRGPGPPYGAQRAAASGTPRVLSTASEFDSVDIILKQYAAVGRIHLRAVDCHASDGSSISHRSLKPFPDNTDLVVVSQVLFMTGQVIPHLDRLAAHCHQHGARLLVDAYHAIGVFPVDVAAINADFVIGGSYKYLRGGPGAAFLYISPDALDSGLRPIDIGWFAKEQTLRLRSPRSAALRPRR